MNYYNHHIGDYLIETAHLSILEDGAYRRLLDLYYAKEAPITSDETQLFRVTRARSQDEQAAIRAVLSEFFTLTESGWTHSKADEAIAAYQVKADANKANGSRGGRPKKAETNPEKTQSVSENNPSITLTNNQEPINKTPHTPQGGEPPDCKKESRAISLKAYLDDCKAEGKKPIPEDDAVFVYAEDTGIPQDFLRLQWCEFKDRYTLPNAKRYKAWPIVFGKSVRGNWFRLWYLDGNGKYTLTTQGQQAQKLHRGDK